MTPGSSSAARFRSLPRPARVFVAGTIALAAVVLVARFPTALPNPATLYLLDVYPYLLDQFHLWHRRMGMDRSPIGNLPCC